MNEEQALALEIYFTERMLGKMRNLLAQEVLLIAEQESLSALMEEVSQTEVASKEQIDAFTDLCKRNNIDIIELG